jgi:hypothetical protein
MKTMVKFEIHGEFHDMDQLKQAVHAMGIASTIWELDNQILRNTIKYDEKATEEVVEYAEKIREKIRELLEANGVPLDLVL